jgi:predicted enzyme related to lactoylglutathione lyase
MDAEDVEALAEFWCAATDYRVADSHYPILAVLTAGHPAYPRLLMLQVPESKTAKNRLHMEFKTSDLKSEAERIARLGGTLIAEREFGETKWIVMQDPEGNEFCLVEPEGEG